MARKVFVSSDISFDEALLEVTTEEPLAGLLWPWFLTRFDDWGRALAHPLRIKAESFAMNPAVTPDVITRAIDLYDKYGLITVYTRGDTRYMAVEEDKWKRYQTHIRWDRKRQDADSQHPAPPGFDPDDPGTSPDGHGKPPSDNVEQHNMDESRHAPGTIPADARHEPGYSTLPPSPPPSPSTHTHPTTGSPPDPESMLGVWAKQTGTRPTDRWRRQRHPAVVDFLEQHPELTRGEAERFLAFAANEGCNEPGGWASWWPKWNTRKPPAPRPPCQMCDSTGIVMVTADGEIVAREDPEGRYSETCPECQLREQTPIAANALSSDSRSRGKHGPLFSTRYGIARRITLQLAQIAAEGDTTHE